MLINLGLQMIDLDVVDPEGKHPVVAALAGESLATLMRRIEMIGGYANVFVLDDWATSTT